MLEGVDVEIDRAVEDGQEVGEVGGDLHPVGPDADLRLARLVLVELERKEDGMVLGWHRALKKTEIVSLTLSHRTN